MKVYLVTREYPFTYNGYEFESILAFASIEEASFFAENANMKPRKKSQDDPVYEVLEMETETPFADRVYVVSSVEESYQYDWGTKELDSYKETPVACFSGKEEARKFLFNVFEQKQNESTLLVLKEFPVETVDFEDEEAKRGLCFTGNFRTLFRCSYEV